MDADAPPADEPDPLAPLTDEFLARRRRGEALDPETFAREHPEAAQDIRAVFPMLLLLEKERSPEPGRVRERFGRWSIDRELGRGGMGVVYLAEDEATGRHAALKLMTADTSAAVTRFRREAEAVARVSHPGICKVLEVGPEGDRLWIALEYIEGETLASALRRERRDHEDAGTQDAATTRDPARWLEVGERVALALHAAHETGLVHRDIKPANIMLAADGRVVVLDFGLAHGDENGEETRVTQTGVPVGTPAYMSPEQVHAGLVRVDRRTDVYSLGATLYEAFTLQPPFSGPTIASLFSQILTAEPEPLRRRAPALSRDLEVVLATALEKRPARRYATARLLAEDLARVRRGERVRARPAGPFRRLAAWAVRHPGAAAVVGSVVLALATGLLVALSMVARVSAARDREAAAAQRARGQALASASFVAQRTDAMLALLLAREAVRAERSPETISQLHAAVHGSQERARLTGHGGAVTSIAWDAQGRRVATGSLDGRVRLFDAAGALLAVVPPAEVATQGEVRVSLAPSGTRLATRNADGVAILWADDGRELVRLAEAGAPADAVLFLPDGSLAVAARDRIALREPDGALRAEWEVPLERASGDPGIVALEASADPPRLHALTRDGRALAYDVRGQEVGRREQAIGARRTRLFDGGRLAFTRSGANDPRSETLNVVTASGAPAGLMGGGFPGDAALCGGDTWWCGWTAHAGANLIVGTGPAVEYRTVDTQRLERPAMVRAPKAGTRLFTARRAQEMTESGMIATAALRLWTPLGAPLAALTVADDLVTAADFAPDGSRIALGLHSGGVTTIHATAPIELATEVPRWDHSNYRYQVLVTSDGRHMVAFAGERRVRVLRDDGEERAAFQLEEPEGSLILTTSLLPGAGRLLFAGRSGAVWVHDLDGNVLLRLPADPPVSAAMWVGTRGAFLTLVPGPRVRFHGPDGGVLTEVAGNFLPADPLRAFEEEAAIATPDRVLVCGPDGAVRRTIAVESSEEPFWYHGSTAGLAALLVRKGMFEVTCRCFDREGRALWQSPVKGVGHLAAVVSRDGLRVAFHTSGGLSLRDASGAEIAHLRLGDRVTHHAFDRAGARLVAGAADGVVRVWDRDGRLLFDLPNQGGASFVGFSDDGRRLATVTSTMARLYTTDVDELAALAERRTTRGLTDLERARFADILAPVR